MEAAVGVFLLSPPSRFHSEAGQECFSIYEKPAISACHLCP
jgi:hypothetical protein